MDYRYYDWNHLIQDKTSNSSDIYIYKVSYLGIEKKDIIYISDCNNADIFRTSNVNISLGMIP